MKSNGHAGRVHRGAGSCNQRQWKILLQPFPAHAKVHLEAREAAQGIRQHGEAQPGFYPWPLLLLASALSSCSVWHNVSFFVQGGYKLKIPTMLLTEKERTRNRFAQVCIPCVFYAVVCRVRERCRDVCACRCARPSERSAGGVPSSARRTRRTATTTPRGRAKILPSRPPGKVHRTVQAEHCHPYFRRAGGQQLLLLPIRWPKRFAWRWTRKFFPLARMLRGGFCQITRSSRQARKATWHSSCR